MICFNKQKSNLKTSSEKFESIKSFHYSLGCIDTSKQKGYACRRCRSRSFNCAFVSFLWVFLQKISPFPERMNPNLVITLSAVLRGPEVNTQRNKSSLLCTKSSGNAHLYRRKVVMEILLVASPIIYVKMKQISQRYQINANKKISVILWGLVFLSLGISKVFLDSHRCLLINYGRDWKPENFEMCFSETRRHFTEGASRNDTTSLPKPCSAQISQMK